MSQNLDSTPVVNEYFGMIQYIEFSNDKREFFHWSSLNYNARAADKLQDHSTISGGIRNSSLSHNRHAFFWSLASHHTDKWEYGHVKLKKKYLHSVKRHRFYSISADLWWPWTNFLKMNHNFEKKKHFLVLFHYLFRPANFRRGPKCGNTYLTGIIIIDGSSHGLETSRQ